jgi:lysophospholipase L1-like esterase
MVIQGSDFAAVHYTDGHGFRNAWPWPAEAEIVVLGDSLAFGYGVEDDAAWPAILDRALPQLRVINLGLIGAGPQQYLRVYETFGRQLRPRLLLVGLFVGNDFWDTVLYDRWLASGGEGNYMVWRDFGRGSTDEFNVRYLKQTLRKHSYVYDLLRHARSVYRDWRSSEPRLLQLVDGSRLQLRPSYLASRARAADPDHPAFQLVLHALECIQEIAKASGSHVLFVFQPTKEEVYMPLLGEVAPDPGQSLRAALDRLELDYLDLTPPFRQRAKIGEQLFFEEDGHPNRQGYQLIAHEVLARLREKAAVYGLHDLAIKH